MKKKLAVEKYYKDKITRLQQDNNNLHQVINTCFADNRKLQTENKKLQDENQQLKEQNERLLEYTELSKEDIKFACKKDKELAKACGMITGLGKSGILGGIFK